MCITNSYVPTQHKYSHITPIGKIPSPLTPKDFRPISNLSILDKTYQRVIAQYIISYTKDIWLNNKQYGFLPKRSTMDAIIQVLDDWSDAKDKHKEIFAIFYDFEKAFDLVPHDLLLKKLENLLPEWLISWLAAYLTDRYQRVKTGKTITEWLLVIQGVIQGSVIGPILFILYIYDINKYIPDEAQLKKYADDILAYLLGDYDRTLPQRITDGVDKWCSDNHMRLNINKCKIISVLPNKNSQAAPKVILHGQILEEVNCYKYLGIHLTNNLNWDSQWDRVQNITQSFPYMLNQLKKAGFRESILTNVYRSHALSHFIYSAPVLTSVSDKAKNEIKSFHANVLRILKLTPDELLKKYNINSIENLIDKTCVDILLRIVNDPDHPITSKLKINTRALDITKKYHAPAANTEAYKNTFIPKYMRLLRDKCANLYLPRQLKDYNTKKVITTNPTTTQLSLTSQQLNKPEKTKIPCPICGVFVKPGSGLTSHQRINKQCIDQAATYTSKEILNSENITTRKTNSKHKAKNSETTNIPDPAVLFLN